MDPVARSAVQRAAQQACGAALNHTSLKVLSSEDRDQPADEDESAEVIENAAPPLEPQLTSAVARICSPPVFLVLFYGIFYS